MSKSMYIKNLFSSILCALFTLLFANSLFAQDNKHKEIPISYFADLPNIIMPIISSDGKNIAYGQLNAEKNYDVKIVNLETGKNFSVALDKKFLGDNFFVNDSKLPTKIQNLRFMPNGNLMISQFKTDNGFGRDSTYVFGAWQYLLVDLNKKTSIIYEAFGVPEEYEFRPKKPNDIWYVGKGITKFQIGNKPASIAKNRTIRSADWQIDDNGDPLLELEYIRGVNNVLTTKLFLHYNGKRSKIDEIVDTPFRAINFVGLNDKGWPLIRRNFVNEFGDIEVVNPNTGEFSTFLKSNDTQIIDVIINKWDGHLIGVEMGGIQPVKRWISPILQQLQSELEAKFQDKIVDIVSYNSAFDKVIFGLKSDVFPTSYFIFDKNTKKYTPIGTIAPLLKGAKLGPVSTLLYNTLDGNEIPVYVTLPPDLETAQKLPTVIFPHDGPESRDEPYYNWWVQFMASRGYLVIQPQFRGSLGFGKKFQDAGRRQWGTKMQDDITDVVNWAIKEGYSDSENICIVGVGYGGYVALQASVSTPKLFKCAASVAGISDLGKYINVVRTPYMRDHIGPYDSEIMEKYSPARHVSKIEIPILLMHGREDYFVDFQQSRNMADILKNAGKTYEFSELKYGDHEVSLYETRLQILQELEIFLEKNIGKKSTKH